MKAVTSCTCGCVRWRLNVPPGYAPESVNFPYPCRPAAYWQYLTDTGMMTSGSAIARAEGLHHSVVNELLRLTLLAPHLIEQLMAGRQPRRLNLMWFQRNRLPVGWAAQREIMSRFE